MCVTLELPEFDLESITDEKTRRFVIALLNIIQKQHQMIETLVKENQELKDEVARLKGEQGKPKFSKKRRRK